MEIPCEFKFRSSMEIYYCRVISKSIPVDKEIKFVGNHEGSRTNLDVTHLTFISCSVLRVPKGLTKIFPNLKVLEIDWSDMNYICQDDLTEYRNLKELILNNTAIPYLPGNLLEGFKNLENFYFFSIKLEGIEPNIFDDLENLNQIFLKGGRIFNIFYSKDNQPNTNVSSMDQLKIKLYDSYPEKDRFFYQLMSSEKALRLENEQLKQERLEHLELISKFQASFLSDLNACFQDETTKDFKVIIGNRQFDVHKLLLIARSPTLAEVLKGDHEINSLQLTDISVEIFEKILRFFYTNELPDIEETNFLHLYAAAGKLKIKDLMDFAETKLMEIVDERNAFEVLKLSCTYKNDELQKKSFNLLKNMYPDYNLDDAWSSNYEFVIKYMMLVKENESRVNELKEKFNTLNM